MGRGVTDIANMLSFPELFLILRRSEKRRTTDLRVAAITQIQAACAPWSKKGSKAANDLIKALSDPEQVNEKQTSDDLIQMFVNSGIPVKQE